MGLKVDWANSIWEKKKSKKGKIDLNIIGNLNEFMQRNDFIVFFMQINKQIFQNNFRAINAVVKQYNGAVF